MRAAGSENSASARMRASVTSDSSPSGAARGSSPAPPVLRPDTASLSRSSHHVAVETAELVDHRGADRKARLCNAPAAVEGSQGRAGEVSPVKTRVNHTSHGDDADHSSPVEHRILSRLFVASHFSLGRNPVVGNGPSQPEVVVALGARPPFVPPALDAHHGPRLLDGSRPHFLIRLRMRIVKGNEGALGRFPPGNLIVNPAGFLAPLLLSRLDAVRKSDHAGISHLARSGNPERGAPPGNIAYEIKGCPDSKSSAKRSSPSLRTVISPAAERSCLFSMRMSACNSSSLNKGCIRALSSRPSILSEP